MFRVLWRFRGTLLPHRRRLLLGTLLVLLTAAVELALPWPLKVIVDDVLRGEEPAAPIGPALDALGIGGTTAVLAALAALLALLAGLAALLDYAAVRLLNGVGERMLADLRRTTFAHLQRLSLRFHDRRQVGDLANRITGDIDQMQSLLVAALSTLLPNAALLGGIVVVVFVVDPVFGWLTLGLGPVLFAVVLHYRRAIKQAARDTRRHEGRVASHVTETLSSIRLVQAYAAEKRSDERFHAYSEDRLQAGLRRVEISARLPAAVDTVAQIGTAVVLFVGALRGVDGQRPLGLLLVVLAYLRQVLDPMRALAKLTSTISRGAASAERVEEVLRVEAAVQDRPSARPHHAERGEVQLRTVTFGYQADRPILHEVSLLALPGQTIALAGPTGAGKSTIAGLLPRLYDPDEGQVLLDGRDLRDYTVESLRQNIAMVLQETVLLTGSILDNIAFGNPDATEEQLHAAAEAAYVDEFVRDLPDGYDTTVSERGTTLSGGQRQRIAVARALVKDAPVVVLDEPTSGLDSLSEQYVLRGLRRLTTGRTVIVIAHRLSTLHNADCIYVIERGRVADVGTYTELAGRPGTFSRMHAALSSGPTAR